MNNNISIPKGCRDFKPEQVYKRDYIFSTLKQIFTLYGFAPIETPSMEQLSTLLGKYGEEGDKLLFKILDSGDFTKNISDADWQEKNYSKLSLKICEKGLRYDLTVPFARFVAMHRNDITFPFKRYQIQPVWRADRPQKGRYREFYQCDVDIIGNNSLMNEIELLMIINDVFKTLQLNYKTIINNRKTLQGLADECQLNEHSTTFFTILDKLDKIGLEQVIKELNQLPISNQKLEQLSNFIALLNNEKNNKNKIDIAKNFIRNDIGNKGLNELEYLINNTNTLHLFKNLEFNILLARGLTYYTGTILEVKSTEVSMGSLCGGGRYDNLTGIFGMPDVSGVGMSFGADRIYDVMESLTRFPTNILQPIDVFLANISQGYEQYIINISTELRKNNIKVDLFPDPNVKLKKQLTIANQKNISWVIIAGEEEIKKEMYLIKNMKTGEQFLLKFNEIIKKIKTV